jgi:hypothetical protein
VEKKIYSLPSAVDFGKSEVASCVSWCSTPLPTVRRLLLRYMFIEPLPAADNFFWLHYFVLSAAVSLYFHFPLSGYI